MGLMGGVMVAWLNSWMGNNGWRLGFSWVRAPATGVAASGVAGSVSATIASSTQTHPSLSRQRFSWAQQMRRMQTDIKMKRSCARGRAEWRASEARERVARGWGVMLTPEMVEIAVSCGLESNRAK